MYVNMLITLQENAPTYSVSGKNISGHVTISSPGRIMCYVQNLQKPYGDIKYGLYVFSKAKGKGARIGELKKEKETRWIVNEKNVQGSNLKLEDIDGVAIVAENLLRGSEMILSGFKESRYMIIPLIDELYNKLRMPKRPKEPDKVSPTGPVAKKVEPDVVKESQKFSPLKTGKSFEEHNSITSQNLAKKNMPGGPGPVIIPDKNIQEGPGPVIIPDKNIQEGPGPVITPDKNIQEGPGPVIIPDKNIQEGPGPVIIPDKNIQEGPGPVVIPDKNIQEGPGPVIIPDKNIQEGPGPVIIQDKNPGGCPCSSGTEYPEGAGPVILEQEESIMTQNSQVPPKYKVTGGIGPNISSGQENEEYPEGNTLSQKMTEKIKILDQETNKQPPKQNAKQAEPELVKIENSEEKTAATDREDHKRCSEKMGLEEILKLLREDEKVKEKAESIKQQIARMHGFSEEDEEDESLKDSSPRHAHQYLSEESSKVKQEEDEETARKAVDYLNEIEKKIIEIEEKRNRESKGL